jgi:hypothetical protein
MSFDFDETFKFAQETKKYGSRTTHGGFGVRGIWSLDMEVRMDGV